MKFDDMKVSTKLWLGVISMVVVLLALSLFAALRTVSLQAQSEVMQRAFNEKVRNASVWAGLIEANAVRTVATIQTFDPSVEERMSKDSTETSARIAAIGKAMAGMSFNDEEKAQMDKLTSLRAAVLDLHDQAFKMKSSGDSEGAQHLVNDRYVPAINAYVAAMRDLAAVEEHAQQSYEDDMDAARVRTLWMSGIVIVIFLGALLAGAAMMIRSIRRPLNEANQLAARIAQGDLSMRIDVNRNDEFGVLMRSLAAMNEALADMVRQVRTSSESIGTASAEIASGNNDLSIRTEQTSTDLQSTASAMGALTGNVQESADNARQASTLVAQASRVAEKGGAVVQEVVRTMEDINTSSRRINDIIGVIDGIAFQTNILALNAAVEAARAGEQGRGFAVVAGEVRSLAQRSAEAAKEIKGLITASVEKVDAGAHLVGQAGETMGEIVQSVREVTDVIGDIAASATDQSAGIAQVNAAIANLDRVTQQNAALVEESAAAATSLRDQAGQLARAVAVFKLTEMNAFTAASGAGRGRGPVLAMPAAAVARKPSQALSAPTPTAAKF